MDQDPKDSQKRNNVVTLMMGSQIIFTQMPVIDDQIFFNRATTWIQDYRSEKSNG
jgi:hypothetical protein